MSPSRPPTEELQRCRGCMQSWSSAPLAFDLVHSGERPVHAGSGWRSELGAESVSLLLEPFGLLDTAEAAIGEAEAVDRPDRPGLERGGAAERLDRLRVPASMERELADPPPGP